MAAILLCGPGEVGKRIELSKIRRDFSPDSVTVLDGKNTGFEELKRALQERSLFTDNRRLVIVENISEKIDLAEVSLGDLSLTLVLLVSGAKETSVLIKSARLIKAKIMSFEGDKEVSAFPFLDSLILGKTTAYVELEKLLSEYGAMYILTMVYYLLRRNLLPLPPSDFMRQKVQQQKSGISPKSWEKMYKLTLLTEFNIKSGNIFEGAALTDLVAHMFMERHL